MPQFVLPSFPAIVELTEGGASYSFTITPDGALTGVAKVRWEIVPKGRIPGAAGDFAAMRGVLDFADGATAGQDITLTPNDDALVEVPKSFVLRIYEVVGEDDSASTAGENNDVRLGDDVPIGLADNDVAGASESIDPRDATGNRDIQLAARNAPLNMSGFGNDDFYVITRYQSGDVEITDTQARLSHNLVKFDFGVEIASVTLNETAFGSFLFVDRMELVLSTGAVIAINAPAASTWRFQFGDDDLLGGYVALKRALGLSIRTDGEGVEDPSGATVAIAQHGQDVAYALGTAEDPYHTIDFPVEEDEEDEEPGLLFSSVAANPRTVGIGRFTGEMDVVGFGANSSLDANGFGGDDVYVVTRFQFGDVEITDTQTKLSHNLVKFDFGVEIASVTLNETAFGSFLFVDRMELVLSTGAVITINTPAASTWRFQFGDDDLLGGYVALKRALGLSIRTDGEGVEDPSGATVAIAQHGQDVAYALGTAEDPFAIPFPSGEPATPDPPAPGPTGPDTGAHYFKWVVDTDLTDGDDASEFKRFSVSDDSEAPIPAGGDAFGGNDLFELDGAVPADTEIDGLGGDDVYLVKSTLAQNITIRDALIGGFGYNLVRFDDDVTVTAVVVVQDVFGALSGLEITLHNASGPVVTVQSPGLMRFQLVETGTTYAAEEFSDKYAEGFASVAIDDTTPQVGAQLAANITDAHGVDESEAINWQWQQRSDEAGAWENIAGAESATYTPTSAGEYVRVTVGYTDNSGNTETVASRSTGVVETPVDAAFTSVARLAIEENLDGSDTAVDIGRVVAEDSNAGDAVAYGLEGVGGATAPAGFEIDAETGVIRYTGTGLDHEGTPENGIAMVVVAASTGADGTDTEIRREIAVEVEDVNDAPELDVNAGLSVNPGQTLAITESDLHASDEDDSDGDDDIVFTVRTPPGRGALQLFGDHDGDGNTDDVWHDLSAGGFFTQTDVNEGRVRYANTGGTAAEDDSFTFAVGDGDITLPDATFAIDII